MVEEKEEINVPEQNQGAKKDIEASENLSTIEEARKLYNEARSRLLNVNEWGTICGGASATFKLIDKEGNEVNREAQVSDYFKIDLPGPGTKAGEGFDWVQVESIEETGAGPTSDESITMRVRPSQDPVNNKDNSIAHFLTDEATSNFVVLRKDTTVTAAVLGRNETPNTKAETILDKARNAMVALGAIAGVANLQWNSLVKGVLGKK
ncbi:MAG: hypothetical protein JWQ96_1581 [Segetibacter sp.]|nr:hypothetical protein [Segetibacter sp.]